ncbi:hypothetical protein AGMMS49992_25110 [Clostridia bacterium]|nr:hypothetical protein AGMMS49992_25110 [Clostridia bacterium]
MSKKKALVLGGTGAQGAYMVPELSAMGYQVDALSLDDVKSTDSNVQYIQANAKDDRFLRGMLRNGYDVVIDFMYYLPAELAARYEMLLDNTGRYIFLSSYRVYAGAQPITEESPRLLDISDDCAFLAHKGTEYSLVKALDENIIRSSKYDNWIIVRPSPIYSNRMFKLITQEADVVVYRARKKLPILLPSTAKSVMGTMIWAGDVAKMYGRLVENPSAVKQIYTIGTAEHYTWGEITEYFRDIIGLETIWVDNDTYLSLFNPAAYDFMDYQLKYDRLFNRVIDNSKILNATGLKQTDLMPLKQGLQRQLSALPENITWNHNPINDRMDEYISKH